MSKGGVVGIKTFSETIEEFMALMLTPEGEHARSCMQDLCKTVDKHGGLTLLAVAIFYCGLQIAESNKRK